MQALPESHALGDVDHESLPVAGSARILLDHHRFVADPHDPPVTMEHTILRSEDLARLTGSLVLSLNPLTVVRVHHTPPEIRVLTLLRRVTRQGLYLGAHVQCGIGTPDLLDVDDRRHPLDEGAVSSFGLPQPLLGPLALGDVGGDTDDSRQIAFFIVDG